MFRNRGIATKLLSILYDYMSFLFDMGKVTKISLLLQCKKDNIPFFEQRGFTACVLAEKVKEKVESMARHTDDNETFAMICQSPPKDKHRCQSRVKSISWVSNTPPSLRCNMTIAEKNKNRDATNLAKNHVIAI